MLGFGQDTCGMACAAGRPRNFDQNYQRFFIPILCRSCHECVMQYRGCCCSQCTKAPRLRPVLSAEETYQRWHNYRDPPPPPPRPPGWVSRRALKRRRRKERRQELEKVYFPKISTVTVADCTSPCPEAPAHLTQQTQ